MNIYMNIYEYDVFCLSDTLIFNIMVSTIRYLTCYIWQTPLYPEQPRVMSTQKQINNNL